jgi:hypothetical protein
MCVGRLTQRVAAWTGALAAVTGVLAVIPGSASAARTGLCTNTRGAPAIIFGPDSFFRPSNVQGPTSFKENRRQTQATYPLYRGTSGNQEVDYVITDASSLPAARALGVNYAPKLRAAAPTSAVQRSGSEIFSGGGIDFPATVNFSPQRTLVPDPVIGYPPLTATPGPVGDPGYSPLVEVAFRGTPVILDAPQIANATGRHPKLVSTITPSSTTASMSETFGCFDDLPVHYVSFDASNPRAAAIENVTYAPAMNSAPTAGCADRRRAPCSRESLADFTNGPTPLTNNQWQGLNNVLLTLLPTGSQTSPFNVLAVVPDRAQRFQYSPLWDIHLTSWTRRAIAAGKRTRVGNFNDVVHDAALGYVKAPSGRRWGASGFVVNCPPVSLNVPKRDHPTG